MKDALVWIETCFVLHNVLLDSPEENELAEIEKWAHDVLDLVCDILGDTFTFNTLLFEHLQNLLRIALLGSTFLVLSAVFAKVPLSCQPADEIIGAGFGIKRTTSPIVVPV